MDIPTAFLSYSTKDDEDSEWFITNMASRIEGLVQEKLLGKTFRIVVDKNLRPGSRWQAQLTKSAADADLFLAILTPSYFASHHCHEELRNFLKSSNSFSYFEERVIPIYLVRYPEFDIAKSKFQLQEEVIKQILYGGKSEIKRGVIDFYCLIQHDDWKKWSMHNLNNTETMKRISSLSAQIYSVIEGTQAKTGGSSPDDQGAQQALARVSNQMMLKNRPKTTLIQGDGFTMGAGSLEQYVEATEQPAHQVNINYAFRFGVYPVTVMEFSEYCISTGSSIPDGLQHANGLLPAVNVSWIDAQQYCVWLSELTGKRFRLPTEAEWEFVCRTGASKSNVFRKGQTDLQIYRGSGKLGAAEVGSHEPNNLGVHDMIGNVREWCADSWHDDYIGAPDNGTAWMKGSVTNWKVIRGASWNDSLERGRVTARSRARMNQKSRFIGFRIAQDY